MQATMRRRQANTTKGRRGTVQVRDATQPHRRPTWLAFTQEKQASRPAIGEEQDADS
jgi:hypothetical protein